MPEVSDVLTLKTAAERYKNTDLTQTALRRAVITGQIPSRRVGAKYLILADNIEKWLRGEEITDSKKVLQFKR